MPPKKGKKAGGARLSRYNEHVKAQLAKLKKENPHMEHRERFKLAAQSWTEATRGSK